MEQGVSPSPLFAITEQLGQKPVLCFCHSLEANKSPNTTITVKPASEPEDGFPGRMTNGCSYSAKCLLENFLRDEVSKGYYYLGLRRDLGRYSRGEGTWPDSCLFLRRPWSCLQDKGGAA